MALLIVVLVIVAICAFGMVRDAWERRPERDQGRRRDHRLVEELYEADHEIRKEAGKARRAMNTAAGQDWRNRFE